MKKQCGHNLEVGLGIDTKALVSRALFSRIRVRRWDLGKESYFVEIWIRG